MFVTGTGDTGAAVLATRGLNFVRGGHGNHCVSCTVERMFAAT